VNTETDGTGLPFAPRLPHVGLGRRAVYAWRMRWKRKRLLFRALRKRRQLHEVANRAARIDPGDILLFSTVRNEITRLPHFMEHYRRLGIGHFLFVDNGSSDGTARYLLEQGAEHGDVSLWQTEHSYRLSRFGMDWLTWLMIRFAHGHWTLTVDADEMLIYPDWNRRDLHALTSHLDATGRRSMGVLMLELYPRGRLGAATYRPGQDPTETLCWFDPAGYATRYQAKLDNILIRGGVRARVFFAEDPQKAPTLSKTPLVRWSRRYAWVSSTHSLLPRRLNRVRGAQAPDAPSGVLLHTKFLPTVVQRAAIEKRRREHFENSRLYDGYYDGLIADPDFWTPASLRYTGWQQLEAMGLMSRGDWI